MDFASMTPGPGDLPVAGLIGHSSAFRVFVKDYLHIFLSAVFHQRELVHHLCQRRTRDSLLFPCVVVE